MSAQNEPSLADKAGQVPFGNARKWAEPHL